MLSMTLPALLVTPGDVWLGRRVVAVRRQANKVIIWMTWITNHGPDGVQTVERLPQDHLHVSRLYA